MNFLWQKPCGCEKRWGGTRGRYQQEVFGAVELPPSSKPFLQHAGRQGGIRKPWPGKAPRGLMRT